MDITSTTLDYVAPEEVALPSWATKVLAKVMKVFAKLALKFSIKLGIDFSDFFKTDAED